MGFPANLVKTTRRKLRYLTWRCIGLGRIEAPEPYIGVCEDGLGRRAKPTRSFGRWMEPPERDERCEPAMRLLDRPVGRERA